MGIGGNDKRCRTHKNGQMCPTERSIGYTFLSNMLLASFHILKRKKPTNATIICLLLTSIPTCFGHNDARNMLR
jgi:hypothetical protein